jgi:hypothetical protein
VGKQPVAKRWIGLRAFAQESQESPDDAEFLAWSEVMSTQQGAAKVERSRPRIGLEYTLSTIGRDEIEFWLGCQKVVHTNCLAEMGEVGAAPHADVLAGIHELT